MPLPARPCVYMYIRYAYDVLRTPDRVIRVKLFGAHSQELNRERGNPVGAFGEVSYRYRV